MEYTSPGGAFSNGIEDYLLKQALMKRQAMLDSLAQRKQDLAENQNDQAMQERQEMGAARRAEMVDKATERDKADLGKFVDRMQLGDQPPPERLAQDKRLGTGFFTAPEAEVPGPSQTGAPVMQQSGPAVYFGNRTDREKATAKKERAAYIESLPEGPLKEAARYEDATGKNVPAIGLKGSGGDAEPIYRQSPTSGKVEQLVGENQWAPVTGNAPKGHWMTEPAPKDTSAAEARAATHRDDVHKTAITELDKWAKPIEDQISSINTLGTSLAQKNNPKADALIAIELLKSTVAGNGVRLTQPEITQVMGGSRSRWDALELKLNAWSGDPTKPLVLTDTEKDEMRSMAKALRTKVNAQHQKITKARHEMDDAKDSKSLNKIRTKLQEDLFQAVDPAEEATATTNAGGGKVIRYDMSGKVIQ